MVFTWLCRAGFLCSGSLLDSIRFEDACFGRTVSLRGHFPVGVGISRCAGARSVGIGLPGLALPLPTAGLVGDLLWRGFNVASVGDGPVNISPSPDRLKVCNQIRRSTQPLLDNGGLLTLWWRRCLLFRITFRFLRPFFCRVHFRGKRQYLMGSLRMFLRLMCLRD